MRGLTISARWPAISARRSRRMSSSLLPLNIGPQMTSSHPPRSGWIRITRGRLFGGADGVEGPAGEQPEADDPERAAVLDHREVAEVVVEHHLSRVPDQHVRVDRDRVRGHPLPDTGLGAPDALRDGADEVALGDDPDDPDHVLD